MILKTHWREIVIDTNHESSLSILGPCPSSTGLSILAFYFGAGSVPSFPPFPLGHAGGTQSPRPRGFYLASVSRPLK